MLAPRLCASDSGRKSFHWAVASFGPLTWGKPARTAPRRSRIGLARLAAKGLDLDCHFLPIVLGEKGVGVSRVASDRWQSISAPDLTA